MDSHAIPGRHYDFDDYFTEADLRQIQTLVKSQTAEPIFKHEAISPTSVEVRCGEPTDHGSIFGIYFILRKRSGGWYQENSGNWGTLCCRQYSLDDLPADALAVIPSSSQP